MLLCDNKVPRATEDEEEEKRPQHLGGGDDIIVSLMHHLTTPDHAKRGLRGRERCWWGQGKLDWQPGGSDGFAYYFSCWQVGGRAELRWRICDEAAQPSSN